MHTDQVPKEKPTGRANYPAGHTDSVIVRNTVQGVKAVPFATLAASFTLAGLTLHRWSSPDNVLVGYYDQRWGPVRNLASLKDAKRILTQAGGAP